MHIVQRLTVSRREKNVYSTGFTPLVKAPGPPIAPETAAPTAPVEAQMLLRISYCTVTTK